MQLMSEKKWQKNNSVKKRLAKGSLDVIIKNMKLKHGVDAVRQRVKRGSNSGYFGRISPMADIEPYLMEIVTPLAKMRMPVSAMQGLVLLDCWDKDWASSKEMEGTQLPCLQGISQFRWCENWRNTRYQLLEAVFAKKNKHLVRTKRAPWTTVEKQKWWSHRVRR
jgi:hypothetical protein